MSLGSNGVDHVNSLWKLRHNFVARTFALIAPIPPVLHRVLCSNVTVPNACKYYETHQNLSLGSNRVDRVRSLWKTTMQLRCTNFCIIAPVRPVLHRVLCSNEMVPNAPNHYEMHQNMSLGSNDVDRVHLLWKLSSWLRCTNFCINCTYSDRFCTEFCAITKWSQMHPNTTKHIKTWV